MSDKFGLKVDGELIFLFVDLFSSVKAIDNGRL